ncbi:receptor-like cytoplasmic kinase 185 [Papaver somniferum]|uniref:receptor-like cytoplasmic kinase 185 n=1 Tax=Papaver somniferum TaxID=3469 RepID=UPI000E6F99C1|nr:receptor-like cytoplasmic kinase 185 [Papaver somniferum]
MEISNPNILLCEGYHPRLSDFFGFKEHITEPKFTKNLSLRCDRHAPESVGDGKLTKESDIYSFGFVLLELISGRNAEMKLDLIEWAKRKLVGGEEFTAVADPLLEGHYPEQGLYQALYLAAECLQTNGLRRPRIGHVVNVLSNLASEIYDPDAIQINQAGTLTIGNFEKERLRIQWQHVCFLF